MRFLLVIFTFLSAICLVTAHTITIPARVKECFFEELQVDDKMTITFQVGDGGQLDIDFWISDPSDVVVQVAKKETTGTFSFTATKNGRYTYCFSNEMSTVTEKIVSFNVHGVVHVPDSGSADPLENEIRELADSLAAVKDEQEYIVIREQRHRDTAESTNDRVKWWSIFQFFVLFAVCFWQVFYLKRFFEVKRVV